MYSRITQTAEYITAEVTRATEAEGYLSSWITQMADEISLKVSKGNLISEINQSAETIRISASKINLDGYVTASQLSASSARIDSLESNLSNIYSMIANNLTVAGLSVTGTLYTGSGQTVVIKGYSVAWKSVTIDGETMYVLGRG